MGEPPGPAEVAVLEPQPLPAPANAMAEPHRTKYDFEDRVARLEARLQDMQPSLDRLAQLENRLSHMYVLADRDRDRLDWTLAAIEGVVAEIDIYHAARETEDYAAAYTHTEPLVSVCVATMDRSGLLVSRCIPSLLAQTYQNLEIIVVGDNCTDDTEARLAAVGDPRIIFHNLPQRGPYPRPGLDRWYVAGTYAMNHAMSLSRGDFVTHIDDDDAMVPHRIATLLAAARETRADFLWHPLMLENADGSWTRVGYGKLEQAQVGTGSLFYHRYFTRFPWDVMAYRLGEPGDWNRIRRIKQLRPRVGYVDEPLAYHHRESHGPFVPREAEQFLE